MLPDAIDPETLRTAALASIGATVLLALLVLRLFHRMVVRVVLLGALAGAGVYLWSQRVELGECVPRCECTFAGLEVKVDVPGCEPAPPIDGLS